MLIAGRSLWLAETNCYLIAYEAGGLGILVDAPPDPEAIAALTAHYQVSPVALLLTHGHVDHMGGAGAVHRRQGATVYVHRDDDYLTLAPEQQLRSLFGMVPPGDYEPPEILEGLTSGQHLELAGINIDVRHTPGHTPGHCCFYLPEAGLIFSGDQLFAGSVGRTDLPGGNWEDLLASMKREVLTLDDAIRVLPGHGPETTIGRERRSNPFLLGLGDS